MIWGSDPNSSRTVILLPKCPDQLHLPILLHKWYWWLFSRGIKWPGHEIHCSPPSSTKVKNEWRYTSIPSICLHGMYSNFTFFSSKFQFLLHMRSKLNVNTSQKQFMVYWFIYQCIPIAQTYNMSQGLGSVLQDLTPKVILSHKYHILPGTAGTELQVLTENSVNKQKEVHCSTQSPFLNWLSRHAQSGRWSSFGKWVWFTESNIVLVWIKVDQLDDTCFIIYCSTCFRR